MNTQRIKVLHVHTRAIIGGSGTNTLLTMAGLDPNRFAPVLACGPGGALLQELNRRDLRAEVIPHLANRVNCLNDTLALLELIRLIRREKFQIVHTHNSKAGILGRLAARVCGVPVVIHTLHSCVFRYPNLNWLERRFYLYLERLAAGWTDKLITISRPLEQEFIRAHVAPADKFTTIYSGIELDKFKGSFDTEGLKREFAIRPGELVVGTVARLTPGKGHGSFLRAAAEVTKEIKDVKFIIVGEGPLRRRLKQLAEQLGIAGQCIFTGLRRDIAGINSMFDLAVLASFYEGMGRVLLEAMACGVPVVANRVGGIPDIVNHGLTGILVPPGDVRALAAAIIRLLKDKTLRQQMGQAALEWASERFSHQRMVGQIVEIYNQFLKERDLWCSMP